MIDIPKAVQGRFLQLVGEDRTLNQKLALFYLQSLGTTKVVELCLFQEGVRLKCWDFCNVEKSYEKEFECNLNKMREILERGIVTEIEVGEKFVTSGDIETLLGDIDVEVKAQIVWKLKDREGKWSEKKLRVVVNEVIDHLGLECYI